MNVKEFWTDKDFNEMGWHDNYIYGILFPDENQKLILDIDYIFEWVLDDRTNLYNFWVSPCELTFLNVSNLKIEIDFLDSVGLNIVDLKMSNPRLYPNEIDTKWDFSIETDKGFLTFESSSFEQRLKRKPIMSNSQKLKERIG